MSIAGHFSDLTGLADEARFWRGKEDFSDASADFRRTHVRHESFACDLSRDSLSSVL
jgi:hypothetical protein